MNPGAPGNFQGGPPPGGFQGRPPGGFRGARGLFFLPPWVMFAILGVSSLVLVVAFWQIYKKAGWSGALGLLMLIPGVNLVAMLFVAFAQWPVAQQLAEARNAAAVAAAVGMPAPVAVPVDASAE